MNTLTQLYLSQTLFLRKLHLDLEESCFGTQNRRQISPLQGMSVKSVMVARLVLANYLQLNIDEIPASIHCCHACNNEWCLNPKHLYFGDASENAMDKSEEAKKKGAAIGRRYRHHFYAIAPTGEVYECFGLTAIKDHFNLGGIHNQLDKGEVKRIPGQRSPKSIGWEFKTIDKNSVATPVAA